MEKEHSLWERLHHLFASPESLSAKWQAALHSKDVAKGINDLLLVQRFLLEKPDLYLQHYLPFLDDLFQYAGQHASSFFDLPDLQSIEEMIVLQMSIQESWPRLSSVWEHLSHLYLQRDEPHEALNLATRVYHHQITPPVVKEWCIQKFTQQQALETPYIRLYYHYLSDPENTTGHEHVKAFLRKACTVKLTASEEEIERAARLAQVLATHELDQVPGITTALGLYALRIEQSPLQAINYFRHALSVDPDDWQAQQGLLLAAIREQSYRVVTDLEMEWERPLPAFNEALLALIKVAHWLDECTLATSVPCTVTKLLQQTERLESWPFYYEIQPLVDFTIGRLSLLEQNIPLAIACFEKRLPPFYEQQMHRYYYLAWAYMLQGESEKVRDCFFKTLAWNGQWTIACLLLEIDQPLAVHHKIVNPVTATSLLTVSEPYTSALRFRIRQVSQRIPVEVQWIPGMGLIEEDLEALRSQLGYACSVHDKHLQAVLIAMPHFQRLPLADRLTWQALYHWECGEQTQALALLKDAAETYHYRRAQQLLAFYLHTQQVHTPNELKLNNSLLARDDLLRAYYHFTGGDIAAAQALFRQVEAPYQARAHFLLGTLLVHQGARARNSHETMRARQYGIEAVLSFNRSEQLHTHMEYTLPDTFEHALKSARFLATGKVYAAKETDPFVAWNTVIQQLTSERPGRVAVACEELFELLQQGQQLGTSFILNVCRYILNCCLRARRISQIEKMVQVVLYLTEQSNIPEFQHLYDLSITILAQQRYTLATGPLRDRIYHQITRLALIRTRKFPLTLLALSLHLKNQNQAAATELLTQAQPSNDFARALQTSLFSLLSPQAQIESPQSQQKQHFQERTWQLLEILTALQQGEEEQCYALFSVAETELVSMLASVIPVEQFIEILYQQHQHQQRPLDQFFSLMKDRFRGIQQAEKYLSAREERIVLQRFLIFLRYQDQDTPAGHFQVFIDALRQTPPLWLALLQNNEEHISQEWSTTLQNHANDATFLHALALLYREIAQQASQTEHESMLITSHLLWATLLRSTTFWRGFITIHPEISTSSRVELLQTVLEQSLEALRSTGLQAFGVGQNPQASLNLRCLHIYTLTHQELITRLARQSITCQLTEEPELTQRMVYMAYDHIHRWTLDVLQRAEEALADEDIVPRSPGMGRRNYSAGIQHLINFSAPGIPLTRSVVYRCFGWYTQWLKDIHAQQDRDWKTRMNWATPVLTEAEPVARQFAKYCAKERGNALKPEIQFLADFYCYQATYTRQNSKVFIYCDQALSWYTDHPWALAIKHNALRNEFLSLIREISDGLRLRDPMNAQLTQALHLLKNRETVKPPADVLAEDSSTLYFYYALSFDLQKRYHDAWKCASVAQTFAQQSSVLRAEDFHSVITEYLQRLKPYVQA